MKVRPLHADIFRGLRDVLRTAFHGRDQKLPLQILNDLPLQVLNSSQVSGNSVVEPLGAASRTSQGR